MLKQGNQALDCISRRSPYEPKKKKKIVIKQSLLMLFSFVLKFLLYTKKCINGCCIYVQAIISGEDSNLLNKNLHLLVIKQVRLARYSKFCVMIYLN